VSSMWVGEVSLYPHTSQNTSSLRIYSTLWHHTRAESICAGDYRRAKGRRQKDCKRIETGHRCLQQTCPCTTRANLSVL